MDEKALAEFCGGFRDDWKETLTPTELKEANKIKLIQQFKVLKDKKKTDADGKSKMTGIGFIEVADPRLAMYLINSMNNFVMNPKNPRGLIVDFALEDHRKLLKRKQKLESLKKKQQEAKAEEAKESGDKKRTRKEKSKDKQTIDVIDDVETLRKMMKETNSRGKRNRIKKRIQKLTGETPEPAAVPTEKAAKEDKVEEKKDSDNEESPNDAGADGVQLSKETMKLLSKKPKTKDQLIEDDIKKEVKKNKKKRKQKRKAEEVDDLMKSFEDRINKRLKTIEDAGDDKPPKEDNSFDDVDIEEN